MNAAQLNSYPILIIDKLGVIGQPLAVKLSKEIRVVLVSGKILGEHGSMGENVVHIPFVRKIPSIPDNKYSHIVVINEDESSLEFLPKIIDKARNTNAELIFAQRLDKKREKSTDKKLDKYIGTKIVLYGDYFHHKLIYSHSNYKSTVNSYLYSAQRFRKIKITGEGLGEVYPVHVDDVVNGIIDVIFGISNSHSLFYAFPKYPTTEMSLAHMIQKVHPEVGIDFAGKNIKKERVFIPSSGKHLLDEKYPLPQKIRLVDFGEIKNIKERNSRGRGFAMINKVPFLIAFFAAFLIFAPVLFSLGFSFLGINTLYYTQQEIDNGKFINAKNSIYLSNTFFYLGKKSSELLLLQGKAVGKEEYLRRFVGDINLGYSVSQGLVSAFDSAGFFVKILGGKSESPADDFIKAEKNLKNAIFSLEKIKAEEKIPAPLNQRIIKIEPVIKLLSQTLEIAPNILGMEGPRKYLVLFQDSSELRPGGGLITSYGVLEFDRGRVMDFKIQDVAVADSKLGGHLEPPFAIRRYLSSEHWFLKDSNYDVGFVKTASASSIFLNAEEGIHPDGVIGVDTIFIEKILKAIGPVSAAGYQEKISNENLFGLVEKYVEKKDFLRALYLAIIDKIAKEDVSYSLLLQAVSEALSEKHLLIYLNNKFQNVLTLNGWSSSLGENREEGKNIVNDFLGIVEANLGGNKANLFVSRKVLQNTTIDSNGNIFSEVSIDYKNSNKLLLGGDYKNYLRLILPKETVLTGISIDGVEQVIVDAITDPIIYEANTFQEPSGLEVEKVAESEKTVYGFLVNVPVGKEMLIKARYILFKKILGLNSFSYNLRIFKQPGVDSIPYSFSLNYPGNLDITNTSENFKEEDGNIIYSKELVGDEDLIVNFVNK